jgi:hypothetical protein
MLDLEDRLAQLTFVVSDFDPVHGLLLNLFDHLALTGEHPRSDVEA